MEKPLPQIRHKPNDILIRHGNKHTGISLLRPYLIVLHNLYLHPIPRIKGLHQIEGIIGNGRVNRIGNKLPKSHPNVRPIHDSILVRLGQILRKSNRSPIFLLPAMLHYHAGIHRIPLQCLHRALLRPKLQLVIRTKHNGRKSRSQKNSSSMFVPRSKLTNQIRISRTPLACSPQKGKPLNRTNTGIFNFQIHFTNSLVVGWKRYLLSYHESLTFFLD